MFNCLEAAKQKLGQVPDEQRLYRDLMTSYESSVRPVLNASETLTVHFKLTLNQIVDLVRYASSNIVDCKYVELKQL